MSTAEDRAWLTLIRAPKLGARQMEQLAAAHGDSAAAALDAGPRAWNRLGLERETIAFLSTPDDEPIAQDLAWLDGGDGRHLLPFTDPRYPERLREIGAPPPALFCLGDVSLLKLPQIGIVGSRNATPQGLDNAHAFALTLAQRGLVITSGLALGIDGAAHRGALDARGSTIAVCGTGLDRVYPARHKELAHAIAQSGLLISEFLPGTAPKAEHFPRRNRLISGLSLGILVVEAARESGSLITARLAADQGREVFAIPGSIHNPLARGCHQLIRQGAKLVETVDDIFLELAGVLRPILAEAASAASAAPSPSNAEKAEPHEFQALLDALGDEALDVDRLIERLGWPAERVSGALLQLELEGQVASHSGGRVMRIGSR